MRFIYSILTIQSILKSRRSLRPILVIKPSLWLDTQLRMMLMELPTFLSSPDLFVKSLRFELNMSSLRTRIDSVLWKRSVRRFWVRRSAKSTPWLTGIEGHWTCARFIMPLWMPTLSLESGTNYPCSLKTRPRIQKSIKKSRNNPKFLISLKSKQREKLLDKNNRRSLKTNNDIMLNTHYLKTNKIYGSAFN